MAYLLFFSKDENKTNPSLPHFHLLPICLQLDGEQASGRKAIERTNQGL